MIRFDQVSIFPHTKYNHFSETETFGRDQNLTMAFGISSFLETKEDYELADYGMVSAYYNYWNSTNEAVVPIKTRPCTIEDFSGQSLFYPVDDQKREEFERVTPKLQCIEQALELKGNFQTQTAKIVLVLFERCDPKQRKTCKSEKETNNWLKTQYLLFAYNKQILQTEKFEDETFKKYVWLDWIPFTLSDQLITPYSAKVTEFNSYNTFMPSRMLRETYYNLQQNARFSYYVSERMVNGIMLDLHQDLEVVRRDVYQLINWLQEIGGFFTSLRVTFYYLIPLFEVWTLEKFLVSRMFKELGPTDDKPNFSAKPQRLLLKNARRAIA